MIEQINAMKFFLGIGVNCLPLNGKIPAVKKEEMKGANFKDWCEKEMPSKWVDYIFKKAETASGVGLLLGPYSKIAAIDLDFDLLKDGELVDLSSLIAAAINVPLEELVLRKKGHKGVTVFFKYNKNIKTGPIKKGIRHKNDDTYYKSGDKLFNRSYTAVSPTIHKLGMPFVWLDLSLESLVNMAGRDNWLNSLKDITEKDIIKIIDTVQAFIDMHDDIKIIHAKPMGKIKKNVVKVTKSKTGKVIKTEVVEVEDEEVCGGRNNERKLRMSEVDRELEPFEHEHVLLALIEERVRERGEDEDMSMFKDPEENAGSTDEIKNATRFVRSIKESWFNIKKQEIEELEDNKKFAEAKALKTELAKQKKRLTPIFNPYGKDYLSNNIYVDFIYEYFINKNGYKKDFIDNKLKIKGKEDKWIEDSCFIEKLIALASTYPFFINHRLIEKHYSAYISKIKGEMLLEVEKWDGRDRIKEISESFTYKDGCTPKMFEETIKNWFFKLFKRIQNPKIQNPMILLDGGQGIGKDGIASCLGEAFKHYYQLFNLAQGSELDNTSVLTKLMIAYIPEIDKIPVKHIPALKALIFQDKASHRKFHSQDSLVNFTLRNSFIASSNKPNFLKDETGNRRYYVISFDKRLGDSLFPKIDSDPEVMMAYSKQVLAQAVEISKKEVCLSEETKNHLINKQESFTPLDENKECIRQVLEGLKIIKRFKDIGRYRSEHDAFNIADELEVSFRNVEILEEASKDKSVFRKKDQMFSRKAIERIFMYNDRNPKRRSEKERIDYIMGVLSAYKDVPTKCRHIFYPYETGIKVFTKIVEDYFEMPETKPELKVIEKDEESLPNFAPKNPSPPISISRSADTQNSDKENKNEIQATESWWTNK